MLVCHNAPALTICIPALTIQGPPCPRVALHTDSCHLSSSLPPGSLFLTQAAKVILCISPAEGLARFGYIYLASYHGIFDSTSHEVSDIHRAQTLRHSWLTTICPTRMLSLSWISLVTPSQPACASFRPSDTMILLTSNK
jgi:hypothetical protein